MRTVGAIVCILLLSCTLALGASRPDMPEECWCLGARLQYWELYSDVANAQLDPVAHALGTPSRAWDCNYCNETIMGYPIVYINDTVARCDAAVNDYVKRYNSSTNPLNASIAWDDYWNNYLTKKHAWYAQLCPAAVPIEPRPMIYLTYQCTCMAARLDYWRRYPDTTGVDPVSHYLSKIGTGEIRNWNCTPCTDPVLLNGFEPVYIDQAWSQNCTYAINTYVATRKDALNSYNPFVMYYNYFTDASNHNLWHSEVCLNQSTPTPITPAPTQPPAVTDTPAPVGTNPPATNPPATNAPGGDQSTTTGGPSFHLSSTADASRTVILSAFIVLVLCVYLL